MEEVRPFPGGKHFRAELPQAFPWLTLYTVMCNQYYFYLVDEDFGPLVIKFCGYFPYIVIK